MVGTAGIEPATPAMSTQCSPTDSLSALTFQIVAVVWFTQKNQQPKPVYQVIMSPSAKSGKDPLSAQIISRCDRIVTKIIKVSR